MNKSLTEWQRKTSHLTKEMIANKPPTFTPWELYLLKVALRAYIKANKGWNTLGRELLDKLGEQS